MWISFSESGNSRYIDGKDICEIYINETCTWLAISRVTGRDIVLTSNNLDSSDIIGNPIVIEADSDMIGKVFDELCDELGLDDGREMLRGTLDK